MSILDKLATLVPMEEIEQGAQQQIYEILKLDCLKKLAIMPDVHQGFFMPIGGVALLDGYVSPDMVGVDIGCGVCHVSLEMPYTDAVPYLPQLYKDIHKVIPTGFDSHVRSQFYDKPFKSDVLNKQTVQRVQDKVNMQLGTLGGGNHFIEIGHNKCGKLCVTIHSGSRNIGHTIGTTYMKLGRLLPIDSALGQSYLQDMNYALEWALENRLQMMRKILQLINPGYNIATILKGVINENHNHAVCTSDGILHRKGATPADKDQLGLVPANMRDGVHITRGLGNTEFLSSASHGCGRTMGRNAAKKSLDYDKFVNQMEGIVCSTDRSILDEAPGAYKDVAYVLAAQEGVTVEVIDFIKPMLNIKAQE